MVGGGGFRVFLGVLPVFGGVFRRGWVDPLPFVYAIDDVGDALGLLVDQGSHPLTVKDRHLMIWNPQVVWTGTASVPRPSRQDECLQDSGSHRCFFVCVNKICKRSPASRCSRPPHPNRATGVGYIHY